MKDELETQATEADKSLRSAATVQDIDTQQPGSVTSASGTTAITQHKPAEILPGRGSSGDIMPDPPRKRRFLKFVAVLFFLVIILGGASAAYYNYAFMSPERLWKGAMAHTAEGLDRMVEAAVAQDAKGFKADGTFNLTKPVVADGSVTAKWYESSGELQANIGAVGARVNMDMQAITSSAGSTPDLYIKLSGLDGIDTVLKSLGTDTGGYGELLSQVNDQWYFIDHTLLDQYVTSINESTAPVIHKDDIKNYLTSLSAVLRDYLFTADSEKAVLIMGEAYGKENFEGDSTYKMKVSIDKTHLKTFVSELVKVTEQSPLGEVLSGSSESLSDQLDVDQLMSTIDETDFTHATADVWIDSKGRFIRNVRMYPVAEKQDSNYIDFGLDYQDSDIIPLSIKATIDEAEMKGTMTTGVDFNQSSAQSRLWTDIRLAGETPVEVTTNLTIVPSDEQLTLQKPADAKNLFELLGGLTNGLLDDPTVNPFATLEDSTLNDVYDDSSVFPLILDDQEL